MIKAVFFDFDDTLGNRHQYAYDCYREILSPYMENLSDLQKEALVQRVLLLDERGDCRKQLVQERLEKECGIVLPYDLYEVWESKLWNYTVPFAETISTLEYLKKKYKLGVITNGHSVGQRQKMDKIGITPYFDAILVSGDFAYRKPDVRLFQEACQQVGVLPKEAVFVGDMFHRDIVGAIEAGMRAIWMTESNQKCIYPVERIAQIQELKDLL